MQNTYGITLPANKSDVRALTVTECDESFDKVYKKVLAELYTVKGSRCNGNGGDPPKFCSAAPHMARGMRLHMCMYVYVQV
jgi:hypothetical protein